MIRLYLILCMAMAIRAEFEGFIIGGAYTPIEKFPHAASISVICEDNDDKCGASILNEWLLLTAAHCLDDCVGRPTEITISVGSRYDMKGVIRYGRRFVIHEDFDADKMVNDIGIIKMSAPLQFNRSISRVAIMKQPPYFDEPAQIAGWGLTSMSVQPIRQPMYLKYMDVRVWTRDDCVTMYKYNDDIDVPPGSICGTSTRFINSIYQGDSGSALVVRGYIQIGIVSFGTVYGEGPSIAIYTDVGYHYEWIIHKAKQLLCEK